MDKKEALKDCICLGRNLSQEECESGQEDLVKDIYNDFEQQLKEKDKEINRLRKQISKNHNVKCACSFCWGVPNAN